MSGHTGSIRVLHVEDDASHGELTGEYLGRIDDRFDIEVVTNPRQGLERVAEDEYDCIVSDYDLPELTGIDFLRRVREDHPELPFILYTGKGSEEVAGDAISAGVTDYLQKETGSAHFELLSNRIRNAVEQYRARQTANQTREQLETLAESTDDILWMYTADWEKCLFINSAYEEIWGRSIEELKDHPPSFQQGAHPDDRSITQEAMRDLSDGESIDIEIRVNADEDYARWIWVQGTPVFDESGEVKWVTGFARDITDRKTGERELLERSNLLDQLFAQIPTHLYVMDDEARLLRVSEYYVDDPAERIGLTDREIAPGEFGEEAHADNMRVIETGEPLINKEEYLSGRDRWGLTSKVPWYDDEGEIAGLLGVTRDITKRKQYEQELERQNERLNRFASIVSHDLRNPLNVAQGRLTLASEECESDHLEPIGSAHARMNELIDSLLQLAREGEQVTQTDAVALNALVEECWTNIAAPDATVRVVDELTIQAEPSRLAQLLENLFRNACDHGGAGVTVTVGALEDGFYVEDDGPGIPESDRMTVFEEGYTTVDRGTGFGLSIAQQVAEAHGWDIRVTEGTDGGARLEITGVEFGLT